MSSKHHILFDLDGTLTDSFKGIVNSGAMHTPSMMPLDAWQG